MKKLYALLIFLAVALTAYSQRLVADGPSRVSVGDQFRISYTVNTQNVNGFRVGNIPEELEVLMGPSTSVQSSYQMINGHTSSMSSITYTYILYAGKGGTYKITPAHISVGGKTISSNALTIHVSGSSQGSNQSSGGHSSQNDTRQNMRAAGSAISSSDLFIKVSANKKRVHEQEPVLLTYKVYTLVDLTQLEGNMPDLKGFHTQEVPLPQQKSFKVENYKGRPYRTVTWSQYVMFPQLTGKLDIPSITFNGIVVQQNRNVDPFEAFFNGGSGYVEVKKSIKAPGISIQVDPLPTRPANFSGGVGRFNISAQLNKKEIRANNPFTLRVVVSGVGNLKLIKEPVVQFPKDFDKYDAKITDKTKLTINGVGGNMIYDILAVPRHAGKYDIPPVTFTYYDTSINGYKTVKTQSFSLDVLPDNGSNTMSDFTGQEDLKTLNKDIHYIKLGDVHQHAITDFFYGSTAYILTLLVMGIIFISLFVVFRHRALENANITQLRGKKANKVATKRLKKAKTLMLQGSENAFYDEVLRALWGYVGDKLNIAVEQLSRDNISNRLTEAGTDDVTINDFIGAIDECEYARYAPGDAKGNMTKVFEKAIQAIMNIEEHLKNNKKRSVSSLLLVLLLLLLPISGKAITKANADSAYARQQYQQAIVDYEELLHQGVSAELYYNLGNAYYRTDNITKAVLNYERALLLSPGDKDIRFNLQMARSKTIDKIDGDNELFVVTWYKALVNMMSVDGWARTALLSLGMAIILVLVYLFAYRIWLRKVGFFGAAALILVFIMSNIFAYVQKNCLIYRDGAIVISPAVTIKSTPAVNGTDLFILHEGTKVTIVDGTMKAWKQIQLSDGKQGWIQTSQIEVI